MIRDVAADQLAVIRIDGMHCHRCEAGIQKKLSEVTGVHEAEVDFNSRQASVLFDRSLTDVKQLVEAIEEAGYKASLTNLGGQAEK